MKPIKESRNTDTPVSHPFTYISTRPYSKVVEIKMAEVKVLGSWGSPFSRRVEMALRLKGVEYELIEEDLSNKSPLLLQYNPIHKKIPVLLHNGKPLAESLVIVEYIDETFPGTPILPQDPYHRALARFWAKFIDEKCMPALTKALFAKEEEQEKGKEEACELLKILDKELETKKFLGGETIGFADIAGNFVAFWVGVLEEAVGVEIVTKEKLPNLCLWKEDFISCDEIKETLPPRDKLLHVFKGGFIPATARASMQ